MNFSVTKNGVALNKSLYTWDPETKVFGTNEDGLVLDFSEWNGVTFKTGYNCTFKTGYNCTFKTGYACTFNTGNGCTFNTGDGCTFNTGSDCTFNTGDGCTFRAGYNCTFNTGSFCTFTVGDNCVAVRYDVKGIIPLPNDKTIKFNGSSIPGYTDVVTVKEETITEDVVTIQGVKYKLVKVQS
jgi:hypothetical protein